MAKGQSNGEDPGAPLLEGSACLYVSGNRPARDVGWLFAWLSLFLLSAAGGIFSFLHRNVAFEELITSEHLSDPASCPLPKPGRSLLLGDLDYRGNPIQVDPFLGRASLWIAVAISFPFILGTSFVLLVRHHARALVMVTIALQIALPAAMAAASFAMGSQPMGVSMLVMTGLTVLLFMLWREQIQLVTKLLGVAGHGLVENPGLIGAAVGIQAGLVVLLVPLTLSTIAGIMNGKVVYNSARAPGDVDKCVDVNGQSVLCCTWQLDDWVPLFLGITGLAQLWTVFLFAEIRTFTVAGAISAWYFEPVASGVSLPRRQAPSRTMRSLRHALGPALGSLCLGSAVLTLMYLARQALESLRRNARDNVLAGLLLSVLRFFLGLVEYATKFATVRMAITGEAFFQAGKNVVDLLVRNFMDAFGVWWLPPMILQSCAFVVSLVMALAMYGATYLAWGPAPAEREGQAPVLNTQMLLALLAFLASWVVLAFFCSLLLNVIDTVFVCYAMDRDAQMCTMLEVHEVYGQLPTVKQVGEVVENPGGGWQYAAPTAA